MTNHFHQHVDVLQNSFGLRVAARLSAGTESLPHDISERLRAAREQALARRKQPVTAVRLQPASAVFRNGNTATLGFGDDAMGLWGRLASAVLVVAMVIGLITINVLQDDGRATEVAEVDAALLTDELPPSAYADPGFVQFLKTSAVQRRSSP